MSKDKKRIKELEFEVYALRLENIQLEQTLSELQGRQIYYGQDNALFHFILENYEQLDSIVARLQKQYNSDTEDFIQQEEDRLVLYNLLELFDDLSELESESEEE